MIVHMFEMFAKKFKGSVKFTTALSSHHSHMIILIILEIYLLTSNWSKHITLQLIYLYKQ